MISPDPRFPEFAEQIIQLEGHLQSLFCTHRRRMRICMASISGDVSLIAMDECYHPL